MNQSCFRPPSRALISGLLKPDLAAEVCDHLRRHGLEPFELPSAPPSSPDAFRELTRNAVCALIDLDQPGPALVWQDALRTKRPALPIIALFENASLSDLLPAGTAGLNGALKIPANEGAFDRFIAPWVNTSGAPSGNSANGFHGTHATATPPDKSSAPPLPAKHLSPHSAANQSLLRRIKDNRDCSRFIIRGPVGAEFHLVALELAALRGIEETTVQFQDRDTGSRAPLLVTSDARVFGRTSALCAMLIDTEKLPEPSPDHVVLDLLPLHQRPLDIAFYARRWLPALTFAAHRAPFPAMPVPTSWCHVLLTCTWPGEFDQLWKTLQRLALLPEDASFPTPLDSDVARPGLVTALPLATARAFRARLENRIPEGLLPAVLSALGCPEIHSPHA